MNSAALQSSGPAPAVRESSAQRGASRNAHAKSAAKPGHAARKQPFDALLEILNAASESTTGADGTAAGANAADATGGQDLATYLQNAAANGQNTGDALAAWLAVQKANGSGDASASGDDKKDAATDGSSSGAQSVAALMAQLSASGWSKNQAAAQASGKDAKTRQQPLPLPGANRMALQPLTAARSEVAGKTQVWDVQDLSHQLRAALAGIQTGQTSALGQKSQSLQNAVLNEHATAGTTENGVTKSAGKGQGAEAKGEGANKGRDLKPAVMLGKPQAGPVLLDTKTAESEADAATARAVAAASSAGHATAAEAATADEASATRRDTQGGSKDFTPLIAAPLDWSAQHVRNLDGTPRAPHMAEQVQQLGDFLAQHTTGNVRLGDKGVEANMKMYPPDLGGVKVTLNVSNDHTATAQFTVERPETAALLQDHVAQFRDNLSRHGLTVDRVQINVAPKVGAAGESSAMWNDRQNSSRNFNQENAQQGSQGGAQDAPQQETSQRQSNTTNDPRRWNRAYDEANSATE